MAINLLEIVQKNLGYPPLHKIDPNTQEEIDDKRTPTHTLGQAAISAVAVGFYKYSLKASHKDKLERGNNSTEWVDEIFGENKEKVVEKVAAYGRVDKAEAEAEMRKVAKETWDVLQENAATTEKATAEELKTYLTLQRANILLYLPEALHMGDHLEDSTLDDRTHKMEGPVSNLIHAIEQTFSESHKAKDPIEETFKKQDKPDK